MHLFSCTSPGTSGDLSVSVRGWLLAEILRNLAEFSLNESEYDIT